MPPMIEVELKFQVPATARRAVEAAVERGTSRRTHLQAIYFDTPDRRLAAAGVALRLRREGRQWMQTAKAAGADAMQRLEHNVPLIGALAVPAGTLPGADWHRHAGTPVGDRLAAALAKREGEDAAPVVVAQYRTDIWRRHRDLRVAGGWVELAFDTGHLIAGAKRLPVCELEIELLRGRPGAVIDVARQWVARHGLWLDVRSKSERGIRLASGSSRGPVAKATPVTLERDATPDIARHVVIANCLQQILPNASEVASEAASDLASEVASYNASIASITSSASSASSADYEGSKGSEDHVHQLRVGLRRLRSALRFFDGWATPVDPAWQDALTQLFRQLGVARDRDALAASLLPALRRAGAPLFELPPAPPGPTPKALLRMPESTQTLLTGLALQIGAPVADTSDDASMLLVARRTLADASSEVIDTGPALAKAAARRLALWHRRIVRAAKRYGDLSDDERHSLRKRVKRLRYATEFTASLYRPKAVARYLARLSPLQESLGRYNDLGVGLETYRAAVGDDPRAWFAIGWLVARREVLLRQSEKALVRFAASEPFWEHAKSRPKHRAKHHPKGGRGAKRRRA